MLPFLDTLVEINSSDEGLKNGTPYRETSIMYGFNSNESAVLFIFQKRFLYLASKL